MLLTKQLHVGGISARRVSRRDQLWVGSFGVHLGFDSGCIWLIADRHDGDYGCFNAMK